MGLPIKDEYKIQDVIVAITDTLFQNVHKILSKHKELIKGPLFNIDNINTRLFAKEINDSLNLPFVKQDNIKLMSQKYDVLKILKSLGFLINTDTHEIRKPFPIGHAEITKNIYGVKSLSESEKFERLKKCFEALPSAYNDIVFINFLISKKAFPSSILMISLSSPWIEQESTQ
ncbi:MAG: hypothetical protein IPJ32_10540 [Sphingobacteriaceae bacterium]|nr:hypothetical protein [Sphingobacteriaceae bacterium]